ncbi:MAG: CHASE domain-containing protein [Mesorhizobium sp.]
MKKLFPFAVFLSVALASLVMAAFAYRASEEAGRIKFEALAEDALSRIEARIDLHLALLRAAHAYMKVEHGRVSSAAFSDFVNTLQIDRAFTGLRGIGFLRLARPENAAATDAFLAEQYGSRRGIWPASGEPVRLPVVLFAPLQDNRGMGFDMYSDPHRRAALDAALGDDRLHATGMVELGQVVGAQAYAGFLVFLRLRDPASAGVEGAVDGLLYAAFRANELFGAALGQTPLLPVNVEIYEGTAASDATLLFRSQAKPNASLAQSHLVKRELNVADQTWTVLFRPTEGFLLPSSPIIPVALGLVGLMLAAAIALLSRWQDRAYSAVEKLQSTTEKSLVERELMLQEMKHRIKNSIARVLAIARQTAAHSSSMDEFSASFSARLQAMAASQDMLTRSRWQKADLHALLRTELEQVFGKNLEPETLVGPGVELDETATQALGLTFHELATNALKYGDAGRGRGGLRVEWAVGKGSEGDVLTLAWHEASVEPLADPDETSFGTKLIDMSIKSELGGRIARRFHQRGLTVTIEVPMAAARIREGPAT